MNSVTPLHRIHRLKTTLLALLSLLVGLSLLVVARQLNGDGTERWWDLIPLAELGGTLAAAGLFGVAWDYIDGRDREAREDERIRRLLKDSAPDFRDAVIAGFAETPDHMRGIATNETLDRLATNALALRLGDEQFAREIYADVRDQVIRAAERWYDVDVSIRLSSALEKSTNGAPLFDVLVEWEYTTVPSHAMRKFACVSARDEFYELVTEVPATSVWFVPERTGVDAAARSSFELLEFSADGEPITPRRSTRRTGQTYSVDLGEERVLKHQPVRLRIVYRTVGRQDAHRLFLEVPAPDSMVFILGSAAAPKALESKTIARMTATGPACLEAQALYDGLDR